MEFKTVTCTECPRGCTLTVAADGSSVTGNSCPRGAAYGRAEVISPVRVVTGTVRAEGAMIPVRTDRPISKKKIFDVMDKIHAVSLLTSVKIGDIIIENADGEGANVIAAAPYKR